MKTKIYVIADLKELQCRKCKMLDVKETVLMEEALSKSIEDRVQYTCNQIQKKFGIDIYGIGDRIKKYDQDIWKKVEKDWDQHFKNLTYEVEVLSSLRTAGVECRPDLTEEKK